MDNLYFKKLPGTTVPSVTGADALIVETSDGKLIWTDSGGPKTLVSVDMLFPVGTRMIQFAGEQTPAQRFGGTWEEDQDYAERMLMGSGHGMIIGMTGGSSTHVHNAGTAEDADTALHAMLQYNFDTGGNGVFNFTEGDIPGGWYPKHQLTEAGTYRPYDSSIHRSGAVRVVGNTKSASSIPPYKVVTVWKRTA